MLRSLGSVFGILVHGDAHIVSRVVTALTQCLPLWFIGKLACPRNSNLPDSIKWQYFGRFLDHFKHHIFVLPITAAAK